MRILTLVAVLLAQAAAQPSDTDVYLATLSVRGNKVEIGTPINISDNPGYDNQPSFTPDGKAVLFTSVRGNRQANPANSAATGSDIYRYDLVTQRLSQVTNTAEAEYSPTVTPDRRHISVIRVEADGTQRLWQFPIDGKTNGRRRRPNRTSCCATSSPWGTTPGRTTVASHCSSLVSRVSLQRFRWRTRAPVRLGLPRPVSGARFSASRAAVSASSCALLRLRASLRL